MPPEAFVSTSVFAPKFGRDFDGADDALPRMAFVEMQPAGEREDRLAGEFAVDQLAFVPGDRRRDHAGDIREADGDVGLDAIGDRAHAGAEHKGRDRAVRLRCRLQSREIARHVSLG